MVNKQIKPGDLSGQGLCLLALEDGTVFTGESFGAPGTVSGELVFNTSMTGYQEILTDPSYAGQVVTLTYPEIGNYGANKEDLESAGIYAHALVVRHASRKFSSWRAAMSLGDFLASHGVPGISGVDTRAITRHIRDKGAMRCAVSSEVLDSKALIDIACSAPAMSGADLTPVVTSKTIYRYGNGNNGYPVAVLDFGIKQNILRSLEKLHLSATVYPAETPARTILEGKPCGILLSNGPGDPAACKQILAELPELINSGLPIFGICLGHQLLSIALGAKTYKLKFGHRGGNQPVKNLSSGKVEVTCQNHGFAVDASSLPANLELTHINLNDRSVEGFKHRQLPIFCVQYHPEACPGPHDSSYLFEHFRNLIESQKKVKV